jgi:hypothetical protein
VFGNFIVGITSGLVVTLSVVVFRALWISKIVPWFEERVYKDAKIEGEWFSLYPTWSDLRQEMIFLIRHGHEVTGTIMCTKGQDEGEKYDIQGSFRNMILPLIYEVNDRTKTDRGTITLKAVENATRLEGVIGLYSNRTDSIRSSNVV